jgi:hypothetical protein
MPCVQTLIHSNSTFWNKIHLDALVLPSALAFVIGRLSELAPVHIAWSLHILSKSPELRPFRPDVVYSRVDALLNLIAPRWETFSLTTEHRALFRHLRERCSQLAVRSLRNLSICYSYMPDYSTFDIADSSTHEVPFIPHPWFSESMPLLDRLLIIGTQIEWA